MGSLGAASPAISPMAQRLLQALAQEQRARGGQAVALVRMAKCLDASASSLLRELAMLNLLLERAQQPAWVQAEAVEGRWMLALTAAGAAAEAQITEA